MIRLPYLLLVLALTGCGVETAGTAAVAAKARQDEIDQARQIQENVTGRLNAAAQLEQQRLDEAARDRP